MPDSRRDADRLFFLERATAPPVRVRRPLPDHSLHATRIPPLYAGAMPPRTSQEEAASNWYFLHPNNMRRRTQSS